MSLRARLLVTTAVLVAAGLLVAGVATHRFLSDFLLDRVDEQLIVARQPAASALELELRGFDVHGPSRAVILPSGTYAEFRDGSGTTRVRRFFLAFGQPEPAPPVLADDLPGSFSSEVRGSRTFTAGAAGGSLDYRVIATGLGPGRGTLIVAIPLADVSATLDRLIVLEAVVGAIVLLAVSGLALWLVGVGLRPLEGMGKTAGAIAAGDLSRRVEPAEERTEIGRLGLALNSMLAQIERAFEERQASEARLRRFVADASHELRTPLTSIRGYAELFRRGAGSRPEDLTRSMRAIEEEASRMGVLVDDLLLLARLDKGRPLERERVDLARVVTDAVESARAVEPDRPIALHSNGPTSLVGDAVRLRQVVDNLLDNVRIHTPPGTPVEVKVETIGTEVVLAVTDQGPGLTPEEARRAFERFYRGDPARARETGGAGLGLSIVAAIVEAHGGTVGVSSMDGDGATFEVRLPATDPSSSTPPESATASA